MESVSCYFKIVINLQVSYHFPNLCLGLFTCTFTQSRAVNTWLYEKVSLARHDIGICLHLLTSVYICRVITWSKLRLDVANVLPLFGMANHSDITGNSDLLAAEYVFRIMQSWLGKLERLWSIYIDTIACGTVHCLFLSCDWLIESLVCPFDYLA